ncbi:Kinase-like domain-containing protein [Madurella fahalii]|uniref:Kinase-like domain-containing protein n=1 Tax=Madurella fahalii TaxID=1157608 RepID=A0ABQ0GDT4_9PEZI
MSSSVRRFQAADTGFASNSGIGQASAPLSPIAAGHGRSDSNASSVHCNKETHQEWLSGNLARYYLRSKALQSINKDFIPIKEIERIVSRENVQEVLVQEIPRLSRPESEEELDRLVQEICGGDRLRRRIFALLLLGERSECIECFIDCGVDDTDLPFVGVKPGLDTSKPAEGYPKSGYWVYSRKDRNRKLKCFDEWKRHQIEWLLNQQHAVAPPFFDFSPGKLFLYNLPEGTVLPFIKYNRADEGGYSSVFKVLIHPAHHNFPGQGGANSQYFAVKTLRNQCRADYEREVEVLQRFSGKNKGHPHLIRLLLTFMYKHEGSYHMIFPWADGGNLRDLWEHIKPERTHAFTCWMISQYRGIADGLREIHGSNNALDPNDRNKGRHGDIKAENILWIRDHNGKKNHLLISDFGLSRFHSIKSQSAEAIVPGCSPSYRPPECDLPRLRISVKYDMWTLGCLLLDFLTWYLLGWEGVENEFSDARIKDEGWDPGSPKSAAPKTRREEKDAKWLYEDKFFKQYRDSNGVNEVARLKPSVINWMEKLHNLPHCPGFAHDVLKIIHQGLLHPDKTKRWESSKVVDELELIWQSCKRSDAYCLEPRKWEDGSLEVFSVRSGQSEPSQWRSLTGLDTTARITRASDSERYLS